MFTVANVPRLNILGRNAIGNLDILLDKAKENALPADGTRREESRTFESETEKGFPEAAALDLRVPQTSIEEFDSDRRKTSMH